MVSVTPPFSTTTSPPILSVSHSARPSALNRSGFLGDCGPWERGWDYVERTISGEADDVSVFPSGDEDVSGPDGADVAGRVGDRARYGVAGRVAARSWGRIGADTVSGPEWGCNILGYDRGAP